MDVLSALFDGWEGIVKICIAAPIMYVFVVAAIRIAGKRSTSQMNNFDWIVTVAIGSLTASGIILDSVTVAEALSAITLLLAAQYLLTRGFLASGKLMKLARANPTLLVYKGEFIHSAMDRERVMPPEILSALRENGLVNVEEAQYVVLENDATFSVIPKGDRDLSKPQFDDVLGYPPESD